MLEIMTDELNRFKFVFLWCEHLYYDDLQKCFCCDHSAKGFGSIISCKRCRNGTLRAYITKNPVIDLRELDG